MIAINKKNSLDMFKSQQQKREHQWFPKLREISCKAEMSADGLTHRAVWAVFII